MNGTGKSTIIKLLLRLYDVNSGNILVNNKDISLYQLEHYRRNIGVVFQDFHIYATSLEQNIAMDYVGKNTMICEMKAALDKSGLTKLLYTLEDGLLEQMGCEFYENGVMLSGGEQQKIALSRIFYSGLHTLIFDESVASLDPISEYEFYKQIEEQFKNDTIIMVSHRLTSTRNADKIFVLSNGQIAEQGSHDYLMKLDGEYAKLFNIQAKKYRLY